MEQGTTFMAVCNPTCKGPRERPYRSLQPYSHYSCHSLRISLLFPSMAGPTYLSGRTEVLTRVEQDGSTLRMIEIQIQLSLFPRHSSCFLGLHPTSPLPPFYPNFYLAGGCFVNIILGQVARSRVYFQWFGGLKCPGSRAYDTQSSPCPLAWHNCRGIL